MIIIAVPSAQAVLLELLGYIRKIWLNTEIFQRKLFTFDSRKKINSLSMKGMLGFGKEFYQRWFLEKGRSKHFKIPQPLVPNYSLSKGRYMLDIKKL